MGLLDWFRRKPAAPAAPPPPARHDEALRALLRDAVALQDEASQRALYEAFLRPETRLILSSTERSVQGEDVSVRPREFLDPKLGMMVIAFTDVEAWEKANLRDDETVGLAAKDLFACAHQAGQGVLINPSGPDFFGVAGSHVAALARGENPLGRG